MDEEGLNLKMAVVCASNQNRSMEAHRVLAKNKFNIKSYGTGSNVRMPGPSVDKPNVYSFGTPYNDMYNDLYKANQQLYTHNGCLNMLDRNRKIKKAPERWQDERNEVFDVVISCEERVFDSILEDLIQRNPSQNKPVYVINVEIRDNHEDASTGGALILELSELLRSSHLTLDNDIEEIITKFVERTGADILFNCSYY